MVILADTNILQRSLYTEYPHYVSAENALSALRLRGEQLCIAPQYLVDFWAVATRSRLDNGLGMTSATVEGVILVVARDGIEPPTPAFSGLRSTS